MGRSAKYYTYEVKQAAKREQATAYRNSEKGKQTKAAANRRRYKKATAVSPAALDDLPDDLVEWADRPVQASFTLHGTGPLLGLWSPPFRFLPPDQDPTARTAVNVWDGTTPPLWCAALGSFQCHAVLAAARDCRKLWMDSDTPLEELEIEVQTEIAARVDAWRALRETWFDESEDMDARLGLIWGAKIVCMLADEWDYRKEGVDVYKDVLRAGEMPWQLMIAQAMAGSGEKR
ncbi:hypothetical protein L227DRAFT_509540 [Lentinus tigrinus ALCF2SS1-6]|uniref:Uncharacterized protein n=1 Tax=Lentinus tigrinus ALCF2SS1-6 TaxID=1328759 RepID=A0A5C2RXJ5_9APHY|nr:hypothetical protein L227DRAFT_509540 [Lentinus tigrinus ALCF2SS1-6]